MKSAFFTLTVILLTFSIKSVLSQETPVVCAVTYVANEGFLITTENHKVMIDALFGDIKGNWCDQPGDSVSNLMLKGSFPFNDIDVVLVTHKHSDHFNESMVIRFLLNNQKSVLICPEQVSDVLKHNADYTKVSDRIIALKAKNQFDTLLSVNKINIRAIRLTHGSYFITDSVTGVTYNIHKNIENLGYIIEADKFTLFHSGDCSPANRTQFMEYDLCNKVIDIAFLDRVFLRPEGMELINEFIRARTFILMHIEPGRQEYYKSIIKSIPEMFVFGTSLETMVIPKKR